MPALLPKQLVLLMLVLLALPATGTTRGLLGLRSRGAAGGSAQLSRIAQLPLNCTTVTVTAEGQGSAVQDMALALAAQAHIVAVAAVKMATSDDEMASSIDTTPSNDDKMAATSGAVASLPLPAENEAHVVVAAGPAAALRFFGRAQGYHPRARFLLATPCSSSVASRHEALLRRLWLTARISTAVVVDLCTGALVAYDPFVLSANGSLRGMLRIATSEQFKDPVLFRFKNLHGDLLNVTKFLFRFAFLQGGSTEIHNERDKLFWETICSTINATLHFINIRDGHYAGAKYGNGTVTGTLSILLKNEADSDYYARPLEYYGARSVEFVNPPIEFDHLVVVVHKGPLIPMLETMVGFFTLESWVLYLANFVGAYFVCHLSRALWGRGRQALWYEVLECGFGIPDSNVLRARVDSERLALALPMLAAVVSFTAFQAVYFQNVAHPRRRPDMKTLEELSASRVSSIYVMMLDGARRIFHDVDDPVARRLRSRLVVADPIPYLTAMLYRDNGALIKRSEWKYVVEALDGVADVYQDVPESVLMDVRSYATPYGSPFLPIFNRIAQIVTESGLSRKWYEKYRVEHNKLIRDNVLALYNPRRFDVALSQVKGPFLIFGVGLAVSLVAFVLEILYHKIERYKRIKRIKRRTGRMP